MDIFNGRAKEAEGCLDRKNVREKFASYTRNYDPEDTKIALKIAHTYRVAKNCEEIARSIGLSDEDIDFAWLSGMLHDIGRFEQIKRYNTFIDSESVDHAEFGADLLFGTEHLIGHIALSFELVYPKSWEIAKEQGYIYRMFDFPSRNDATNSSK